jgi:hypothetical protein
MRTEFDLTRNPVQDKRAYLRRLYELRDDFDADGDLIAAEKLDDVIAHVRSEIAFMRDCGRAVYGVSFAGAA